nr:MAG TPA: Potassium channel toxin alpha-KTx 9.4-2, Scorpion Toxin, Kv1.1, Disulfide [Bacteriophage sp.]
MIPENGRCVCNVFFACLNFQLCNENKKEKRENHV